MSKTVPVTLVNFTGTTGAAGTTFVMSTVAPYGTEAKQNFSEACVVANVSQLTGTTPGVTVDVYEYIDSQWLHVGTTGTITAVNTAVIDSAGGSTSSGTPTFAATTNLRALGKGVDMKVVLTFSGTIATMSYVIDYIGYNT